MTLFADHPGKPWGSSCFPLWLWPYWVWANLLHIIGLATPEWVRREETRHSVKVEYTFGLWEFCTNDDCDSIDNEPDTMTGISPLFSLSFSLSIDSDFSSSFYTYASICFCLSLSLSLSLSLYLSLFLSLSLSLSLYIYIYIYIPPSLPL